MQRPAESGPTSTAEPWRAVVAGYHRPAFAKSAWQLTNSLVPFVACWFTAYRLIDASPWAALALCVLAAGFLLRINIIQHDCGHGSFLESIRANDVLGSILGVMTIIPYFQWRHHHAMHHAASGNLNRRGVGDVWVMTIGEYEAARPRERLRYRIYRNPLVLFGIAPLVLFLVLFRLAGRDDGRRERLSVYGTNAAIACIVLAFAHFGTLWKFVAIEGAIVWIDATVSVWLFYMQHQFEHTSWSEASDWDFATGALEGASWYLLPKVLQWFSGNIGIHHIHHLSPRIPNYELQRCLDENPVFQNATVITLWKGFRCASLRIWDEDSRRLVTWKESEAIIRRRRLARHGASMDRALA